LRRAVELRNAGKPDEARTGVLQSGVPLWLAMAPLVRQTMTEYQAIIATRNDLGQLASMQNKFVRIALERLRLSIKEFVNELPAEMDRAYAAAISPDGANPLRLFIPTRPSLLKPGETLRILINIVGINVAGQSKDERVRFFTRRQNTQEWNAIEVANVGRGVYSVKLGPFDADAGAIEYYATLGQSRTVSDPPQAPANVYTLNIMA
jgi:hypothetical protein